MQQALLPYRTWLPISTSESLSIDRPSSSSINDSSKGIRHVDFYKAVGGGGGGGAAGGGGRNISNVNMMMIRSMVMENAIIIFGRRGCCMCHVVKRLLLALGVNPAVYEVDREEDEALVIDELTKLAGDVGGGGGGDNRPQFPSVYIGGRLFGGLDQLMAAHISGELIPILKKAGALWL
ncbi:Glutaredoxin [Macleaya cordata]|uniref:Glutaredoxin n=1 Tax=Macleaya cordata TaxID=56857 RepID=A0A200QKP4_MACCD|nr:Glutaredoxin [Macleaya cordata]